jgi:hypothetical protein
MAETKYTYAVSTDTANGVIDAYALEVSIRDSAIVTSLNRVDVDNDTLDIWFNDILSAGDQTLLTAEVSAHDGLPIEEVPVSPNAPFADKVVGTKSLFIRTHGCAFTCIAGTSTHEFTIPYPQVKFNEIEILGAELGDHTELKILDDASGSYSTVPNYQLNQFGFSVYPSKDYYDRVSNYDADLYYGMRIVLEYTSLSAKDIYINFVLHELK